VKIKKISSSPRAILSILVLATGVVNLISSLYPSVLERKQFLSEFLSVEAQYGGRLTALFLGMVLIMLAPAIHRGKKTAYFVIVFTLVISALVHLIKGFDWEESLFNFLLLIPLLKSKNHFSSKSNQVSLKKLPVRMLSIFLVIFAYGISGFFLYSKSVHTQIPIGGILSNIFFTAFLFYNPNLVMYLHQTRWFIESLYLMGSLFYIYTLFSLLSPVFIENNQSDSDRERVKGILGKYIDSPISSFAFDKNKRYFFYKNSVIIYALYGRYCIVLGDPIGPKNEKRQVVTKYTVFCNTNDWIMCFYQIKGEYTKIYKNLHLSVIGIGEETIVKSSDFKLEGSAGKEFRNNLNKIEKIGFYMESWGMFSQLSQFQISSLKRISDTWLQSKGTTEMGFAMGKFDSEVLQYQKILVVKDPLDQIIAFISLIELLDIEIAVDLMRHTKEVPNGIMDYLFTQVILYAKDCNIERVNLGLSPLSGVGDKDNDPIRKKLFRSTIIKLNRSYNFQDLNSFKKKYRPTMEPRFVAYKPTSNLAGIGLALKKALTV